VDNIAFTGVVETPFATVVAETSNCVAPAVITVSPTSFPVGFVGTPYNVALTTTGGTAPYNYAIVQPYALPPGLAFSTVNGNLQISGTPTLRGAYPVTFKVTDSNNVQVIVSYALIIDTPIRAVSGIVTYGNALSGDPVKHLSNVNFSATGDSTDSSMSDSSGAYLLNNLKTNGNYTVTPTKSGEVNNAVTSFDAALAARYGAELITLTPNQLLAGDVSGNGQVTAFDAGLIAGTAGMIANSGSAGQWRFLPSSKKYPYLSMNETNQNYQAILMGDISGNWAPTPPNQPGATIVEAEEKRYQLLDSTTSETAAGKQRQQGREKQQSADTASAATTAAGGILVDLPNDAKGATGSTVLVPINIGDVTGQGIIGYSLTVSFNQNVLQLADPSFETAGTRSGTAGFVVIPNTATAGQINIQAFGPTQDLSGSGVLIYLRFNVIGMAGTTSNLTFNNFRFNEGEPAASTDNGQFTATVPPTAASVSVSGRVTTAQGRGIAKAQITLTDSAGRERTVQTTSFGYYRFEAVEAGETVTVAAKARRYRFNQSSIVRTANDSVTNADFVAID
jgi:hypothetical protein